MSNKKIAVNLIANGVSFVAALGISFFLTPYIVKTLGAEAYGFVSLANNFVMYISLVTIALNSMAGRFVSIKIYQNDIEGANRYFSSVIIANFIISIILIVPAVYVVSFIDRIINVPPALVNDVRMLFALIFLGFLISIMTSLLSVSLFVTNKLYLSSLRNVEGSIIRAVVFFILFSIFPAKVFYVGLVSIIVQVYIMTWNLHYTKSLFPELKLQKQLFDFNSIKELISSGIWNVVSQLSLILNEGLDLLISNLLIGPGPMGMLAIAKTIPSMIMTILGILSGVFAPELTRLFAADLFDEMKSLLKQSIKILGIFVNIPIAGLIVFGDIFYKLWMPTQDANQLQILSILTVLCLVISGSTASIYTIFTVTNNVKLNSLIALAQGILSILIVIILLKTTDLGIYAVAGVSSVLSVIRNLVFTFPYGAKCMKQDWYVLYLPAFRTAFSVVLVSLVCLIFRYLFVIDTWVELIGFGVISGIIGLGLNVMIIFSKDEKKYLVAVAKSKLGLNS